MLVAGIWCGFIYMDLTWAVKNPTLILKSAILSSPWTPSSPVHEKNVIYVVNES